MPLQKVVLAYSGGLDTSCILKWLLDQNYQVICYMANIGQNENFDQARAKALKIGASEVVIEDVRQSFVCDYIWPAVQAGLVYESRYLLGTALARPCISVGLVNCAKQNGAEWVSHGATGKGNDQVRFELSCCSLWPEVKIIAPWRDDDFTKRFQGRQDLLEYASLNSIPVSATPKEPWSTDANLLHISYESGLLENAESEAPDNLYQMTKSPKLSPDKGHRLEIHFRDGLPSLVKSRDSVELSNPLEILDFLNIVGGENGVGRIDIVENRFIGLKSRGIYETPGGSILHVAHTDLEVFCLDREVYRIKQSLRERLSDCVYNGFWFSPEACFIRKCVSIAEENVTGVVKLEIYKGNVFVLGRSSDNSLYNQDLVSMDKHSDFTPSDATGFINIQALRLKEYYRFQKQINSNK